MFDEYGQPDYEAMILARREAWELAGDCDYDCTHCYYSEVCDYAEDARDYADGGEEQDF